jgi:hypothetical protein
MNTRNKIVSATAGLMMLVTAACGTPVQKSDVRQQFTEADRRYGMAWNDLSAAEGGFEERQDVNKDGVPDIVYMFKTREGEVLRYYVKAEVDESCRLANMRVVDCVERDMYRALPRGDDSVYQRMK